MEKVVVAEIGSTTTVVNAFGDLRSNCPRLLGQGISRTTVEDGDVAIGLRKAINDLEKQIGPLGAMEEVEFYASSSAAGGLKMTVHGLVPDLTARAAREAALGAGAVVHYQTAGELREKDWERILTIKPNIMLLAGGMDYGEQDMILHNAQKLTSWFTSVGWRVPVIYAGNAAIADLVQKIFKDSQVPLTIVPNVYPDIDRLNIEPTLQAIQAVFQEHITEAPGMQTIRKLVKGTIKPTAGAVMDAARLVYEEVGDVLVFDVGGATTDVHSVTPGAEENQRIALAPEPLAKRTVEGDLGIFVNARQIAETIGEGVIEAHHGENWLERLRAIPETPEQIALSRELAFYAVKTALNRHCGRYRYLYGASGQVRRVEGRDLSRIRWVIGTGGALTRLPEGLEIIKESLQVAGDALFSTQNVSVLLDRNYIMASLGVLMAYFKKGAWQLLRESIGVEN